MTDAATPPPAPVPTGRQFNLEDIFSYHAPGPGDQESYEAVRGAALVFSRVLEERVPPGPDYSDAIRKLRECVSTANAGIALKGKLYK